MKNIRFLSQLALLVCVIGCPQQSAVDRFPPSLNQDLQPISSASNRLAAPPAQGTYPEEDSPRYQAVKAAAQSLNWVGDVSVHPSYNDWYVSFSQYYFIDVSTCAISFSSDNSGYSDDYGSMSTDVLDPDYLSISPGPGQNVEHFDFHGYPAVRVYKLSSYDQISVEGESIYWNMGDFSFSAGENFDHPTQCGFSANAMQIAEALYKAAVDKNLHIASGAPPVECDALDGLDDACGQSPEAPDTPMDTEAPTPQASPTPGEQIVLRASMSGFSEDIQAYSNPANAGSVFIYGMVTDRISGEPLPSATVEIISGAGPASVLTAADGSYSLVATVPGGGGSAEAILSFSLELTAELRVEVQPFVLDDFLADGESTAEIQATVYDPQGNPMAGRSLEFTALTADGSPWGEFTVSGNLTDAFGTAYAALTSARYQPGTITTQDALPVTIIVTDSLTGVEGRAQIDVNHYFAQVNYYPTLPTCAECSPYPITVTVLDIYGNPVAGVPVIAQLQSGAGELMVDKFAGAGIGQVSAESEANGQTILYLKPTITDLTSESSLSILVYEEKTSASAKLQIKVEPLDIALSKVEQVAFTGVTNTNAYFYLHIIDRLHRDAPLDRLGLEKNSPIKYLVDIKQFYSDGSGVSPGYLETTYLARTDTGGFVLKDFNNNPPTPHVVPVNDGVTFYRVRVDAYDNDSGNPIYDPYLSNNDTIIAVRTGSPDGWLHTFLMNGALSPSNYTGALIKCAASFVPGLGDALTLIDALNEGYKVSQSIEGNEWDLYALGQKLVEATAGEAAGAAGVSTTVAQRVGVAGKIAACVKDHAAVYMSTGGQTSGARRLGGALCLQAPRSGSPQGAASELSHTFDHFFHGFIADLEGYQGVVVMTPLEGSAQVLDSSQTPVNSSLKSAEDGVSLFILPGDQPFTLQVFSPGDANVAIYQPGDGMTRRTIRHDVTSGSGMTGVVNLSPGSDYSLSLDTNGDGQADQNLNPQITALDVFRPIITEYSPTGESGSRTIISASFTDEGGSGIDPSRLKIVVDGVDLTSQADVTANGVSVEVSNLAAGEHWVVIGVQDGDGNTAMAEWSFRSTGAGTGGAGLPMVLMSILAGLVGLAGVIAFGFILLRKPEPQPVGPQGYYPPQMTAPAPASSKRKPLLIGTGAAGFGCLCLAAVGLFSGVIMAGSSAGGVDIQAAALEATTSALESPQASQPPAGSEVQQPENQQALPAPTQVLPSLAPVPMETPAAPATLAPELPPAGAPWANPDNPDDWFFYDDFSTFDNGWDEIQTEKSNAGYHEGGTYGFYFNIGKIIRSVRTPLNDLGMLDDIEVAFSANSPEGSGFYGAICRFQDDDNYYMAIISDDGTYSLAKRSGGEFTMFVDAQALPGYQPLDLLRLRCEGDSISLYVDDLYAGGFNDSEFPSGYTGIVAGTFEDQAGARVLFHRFMATLP